MRESEEFEQIKKHAISNSISIPAGNRFSGLCLLPEKDEGKIFLIKCS